MKTLQWGLIGAGTIANEMATAMKEHGRHFYAVANRTVAKAEQFAEKYDVEKVYPTAEEMLMDENVDIVYVATTHNHHYEYIRKALEAHKHVLAEKAITLNSDELNELIEIAEKNDLILAEAMTIYHMPLHRKIREMIDSGETGKVFTIIANFGSYRPYDPTSRFFSRNLAGGAMLDIGVYAISMVRFFLSAQPDKIISLTKPSFDDTDEQFGIVLQNNLNEIATINLSMHVKLPKRTIIGCEKGYFEVMEYPRATKATYTDGKTLETTEIETGDRADALIYEVEDMEKAIANNDKSIMKLSLSHDVMEIMTTLRRQHGYSYPEEEQ